jgi:hypothetical protein
MRTGVAENLGKSKQYFKSKNTIMKMTKVFIATGLVLAVLAAYSTNRPITDYTSGFGPGSCSTSKNIDDIPTGEYCNLTSSATECTVSVNGTDVQAYDTQAHCNAGGVTGLLWLNTTP